MLDCYLETKVFSLFLSLKLNQTSDQLFLLQRAKKVVSDSPGLVDFVIGLVNSVLNLPDGQVKTFWRIKITEVL